MTRRKKKPQIPSDEKLKARKRARKPETVGRKPARVGVQRQPAALSGSADAGSIRNLQQTVGNQVVARLVAQGAGAPAVQREAITPASEEKDLVGGATTKATMPGAPSAAPMPFPNMSQPPGTAPGGEVASGSKLGGSMGDEAGTMAGMTSMNTASNAPGQSNVAIKPSAGIVPIQGPGMEEGSQPPPAPAPQPEEQQSS